MNDPENAEPAFTPPRYHTYLLRCWQENSKQADKSIKIWRFSLEDSDTGQRRGFASLEALLASLLTDLADEAKNE